MGTSTFRGPTPLWQLNKIERDDYLLYMESRVLSNRYNFQGVMGLTDRPTESLFLADGVYSLWTRSNRNERT